ncbi:MAG TPA: CHRD domain-containing protein [Actinomycetota bacterium]|nr:CHRD domain-containing protein [Actinomycetota bacterium]
MVGGTKLMRRMFVVIVGGLLLIPVSPAMAAVTTLEASLSGGAAEVPDPGDPDGSGAAQVKINVKKQKLCYTLVVVDVSLPTAAAHIHEGGAGVAGPIAVALTAPEEVAGSGIGLATGCVKNQAKRLLRTIKRNPQDYYVNVHNADYPGGAVRGQLEAA